VSRPGWYWPLGLAALLVGSAAANIALIVITARDASFAVEPDYYAKALAWDETMAQARRNEALGWSLGLGIEPAGERGRVTVAARLADRSGAPLDGARVSLEALHNARASRVLTATLEPRGAGYAAVMPLSRPGLWEFRVRVTRGADVFTAVIEGDVRETR
jgi:nitrogen fixation protein FixH